MSAGRKPDYLQLVEAAGANYVPEPIAEAPDQLETLDPPEVVAVREVALSEWERITTRLAEIKLISALDLWTLADYCLAVADFVECEEWIRENGGITADGGEYTTNGRNGIQYKPRPVVARRQEALKRIASSASEFGLSPRARVTLARGVQGSLFDDEPGGIEGALRS